MKRLLSLCLLFAMVVSLAACAPAQPTVPSGTPDTTPTDTIPTNTKPAPTDPTEPTPPPTTPPTDPPPTTPPTDPPPTTPPTTPPTDPPEKLLIVIDPGHQAKGNYSLEPIGPGATEMKAKVSSGTQGRFTGLAEYKLNMMVSLKLKEILEQRGYEVKLTRESHDVDLSNSQRAQIANDAGADAFIRIHANGSEDPSVSGAMTICQTPNNPYNGYLFAQSYALSACVLDGLVASAGCVREYVWQTDTMSGINWCTVPTTIVEMGYMTNQQEDVLLSQEDYQWKIANGIADGIDAYFS